MGCKKLRMTDIKKGRLKTTFQTRLAALPKPFYPTTCSIDRIMFSSKPCTLYQLQPLHRELFQPVLCKFLCRQGIQDPMCMPKDKKVISSMEPIYLVTSTFKKIFSPQQRKPWWNLSLKSSSSCLHSPSAPLQFFREGWSLRFRDVRKLPFPVWLYSWLHYQCACSAISKNRPASWFCSVYCWGQALQLPYVAIPTGAQSATDDGRHRIEPIPAVH